MLARSDIDSYITDNYGTCDRGADCYHGRDKQGRLNGCLKVGWKGISCRHWRPVEDAERERIAAALRHPNAQAG